MAKRINPRRKVVTAADIEREVRRAATKNVVDTMAIVFTVLVDKEGWSVAELQKFWEEINYLSDSIDKGYVKISDLLNTLRKEYEIELS